MSVVVSLPRESLIVSSLSVTGETVAAGTFSQLWSEGVSGCFLSRLECVAHNFPIADLQTNGRVVVTVSDHIRVLENNQLLAVLNPHNDNCVGVCPFTCVAFCQQNPRLFAVSDLKGYCSIYDSERCELVELIALAPNEILYSVAFVTENIIAAVAESGNLYVMDRRSHQAVCSEMQSTTISQPRLMSWLPGTTMVAVAHQAAGNFSVYEMKSINDAPRIVGATPSENTIAGLTWIQSHPQYIAVARDSGKVEVWNSNNFVAPHFDFSVDEGAASLVSTRDGFLLVGTSKGKVIKVQLPAAEMTSAPFMVKFDEEAVVNFPALE